MTLAACPVFIAVDGGGVLLSLNPQKDRQDVQIVAKCKILLQWLTTHFRHLVPAATCDPSLS